jgi:hypothetical protein
MHLLCGAGHYRCLAAEPPFVLLCFLLLFGDAQGWYCDEPVAGKSRRKIFPVVTTALQGRLLWQSNSLLLPSVQQAYSNAGQQLAFCSEQAHRSCHQPAWQCRQFIPHYQQDQPVDTASWRNGPVTTHQIIRFYLCVLCCAVLCCCCFTQLDGIAYQPTPSQLLGSCASSLTSVGPCCAVLCRAVLLLL